MFKTPNFLLEEVESDNTTKTTQPTQKPTTILVNWKKCTNNRNMQKKTRSLEKGKKLIMLGMEEVDCVRQWKPYVKHLVLPIFSVEFVDVKTFDIKDN